MKILIVKTNKMLNEKNIFEIRNDIKAQINDCGIVVLDSLYKYEVVEFDALNYEGEMINYADTK